MQLAQVISRSRGAFALLVIGATLAVHPLGAQTIPESKQTNAGLYIAAADSAGLLADDSVVLVDVRSRSEVMVLGLPVRANVHIPYMDLPPMPEFDPAHGTYRLEINPDFASDFRAWADSHGVSADTTIVLMCRSGQRSARAANLLAQMGYNRVYSMIDGYEGDRVPDGPQAGQRLVNGWRNAGLPWTYQIAQAQVYPADN